MKIKKHIEIVRSSSVSLSSMGQKSCDMIKNILERHYEQVGVTTITDMYDLESLVGKNPDLAFLGVKKLPVGSASTTIWLSAYLEAHGVNYTGSTANAIALDFHKPNAKEVIKTAGLRTSAFFNTKHGQYHNTQELPLAFPLFVKPPDAGGGKGIDADSVVHNFAAYERKVRSIVHDFDTLALVEAYLPGREFSVAILESINSKDLIAMPIELVTAQNLQGDRILGQNIKAADTEHVVAIRDTRLKQAVTELAVGAFRALGARDYGRIDIRLDAAGVPHFLEANLIPGLAYHDFTSYFTSACWLTRAMDYEAMILYIVELGLARNVVPEDDIFELMAANYTALPFLA